MTDEQPTPERTAHAILKLAADIPGTYGRLRTARVVIGHEVDADAELATYAVAAGNTIRETVELIDALIAGGLITQTAGQRPTLVLTRPGFRALEALESEVIA